MHTTVKVQNPKIYLRFTKKPTNCDKCDKKFNTISSEQKAHSHQRTLTETPADRLELLSQSKVRLSVWNLHSKKLQQNIPNAKKSQPKPLSGPKSHQPTPNYITKILLKNKVQKQKVLIISSTKNIHQASLNSLYHTSIIKPNNLFKINRLPTLKDEIKPPRSLSFNFSKKFQQFKLTKERLQSDNITSQSYLRFNTLQYTSDTKNFVDKNLRIFSLKKRIVSLAQKYDQDKNFDAWSNLSHRRNDNENQERVTQRKRQQQLRLRNFRKRKTKSVNC